MHLDALVKRLAHVQRAFKSHFRASPDLRVLVPGCVDLLGAHTLHHDGLLLAAAIDKNVLLAVRPRADKKVVLHFLNEGASLQFSLYRLNRKKRGTWGRHARGIGWLLRTRGYIVRGLEGVVHSTIPIDHPTFWPALQVGLLWAWNTLDELEIPKEALPGMCADADKVFVKNGGTRMPCLVAVAGRQGHAMMLDCREDRYTYHPWPAHVRAVICEANARPASTRALCVKRRQEAAIAFSLLRVGAPQLNTWHDVDVELLERHRDLLNHTLFARAYHQVTEMARVREAVRALDEGDVDALGRVFDASFHSQKDAYDVISEELETLWTLVHNAGAYGARLLEECYGGNLIALVPTHELPRFQRYVVRKYRQLTGREAGIRPIHLVDGVMVL